MRIASPLRYTGSRNLSWRELLGFAPLEWTHYREPFCGSASLLLYLPKCEAWINDLNPAITRFHQTLSDVPEFIPVSMKRIKKLDTPEKKRAEFERVKSDFVLTRDPWATFILNRFAAVNSFGFHRKDIASFSTAYTRCGFHQHTEECLRAEREALIRNRTRITTGDYYPLLTEPGQNVWIYLDPPYRMDHHKSPYYEMMFTDDDHRLLAKRLKDCPHPWLLTINRDRFTERLYAPLGDVQYRRYRGTNAHQNQRRGEKLSKPWRTEMIVSARPGVVRVSKPWRTEMIVCRSVRP